MTPSWIAEPRRLALPLAAGLLLLLASVVHAAAQAGRSLRLDDFSARIEVRTDGSIEVTESLRYDFRGAWREVFRSVSLHHEAAGGRRSTLRLEVLGVTDEHGAAAHVRRPPPRPAATRSRYPCPAHATPHAPW
jgi:hypothetical protein